MATAGPNYPGTGASLANAGTSENANAWATPENVGASSAVATITAASYDSPDISEILVASNFGFAALLTDADTVTGITVEISKRGYTSANSGKDFRVQLSTGTAYANLVGTNKASANVWPQNTLATTTYGGTTDHWNAGLTAAQVRATGFAVFLSAYANVANADIAVDWIRVTITYTPVFTGTFATSAAVATSSFTAAVAASTTGVARISLAPGYAPDLDTGHSIKVRARINPSPGGAGVIKAALYEGASNRSGDLTSSALTTSLADYTLAISEASAADIASYSDLEIRLWGYSAGGGGVVYEVDQLYLETPEATAPSGPTGTFAMTTGTVS